jgi:DNA mismatch repair protein MSH4
MYARAPRRLSLTDSYSVPATYASFPIFHQLFARLGMDDNIETNVSTFAAEMKEIAFILRNIDRRSLYVIVTELYLLSSC